MVSKKNIALITLVFETCVSTAFAQTLLWKDDFIDPDNPPTTFGSARITVTNQQIVFTGTFFSPTPTNAVLDTAGWATVVFPNTGPLPDQQTLELRIDLISANQNDAFGFIQWATQGKGYSVFKDQDEVGLLKFWDGVASSAVFFWEQRPLKNEHVTVALSLTRLGSGLRINTRVLDKDNANAVLFERTVVDTPQSDPALPNGAVKGICTFPDLMAAPWPLQVSGDAVFGLWWGNTERGPQPAAEVIFDNLEVWQYESPQLEIQNAVVLSWPVTQGEFVLESASSVNGPWEQLPEPWWRTNNGQNEVTILAPDSLKLFRLRQVP